MTRPLQSVTRNAIRNLDTHLALLLKETKDLESAKNELRWLKEYNNETRKDLHVQIDRKIDKGDKPVDRLLNDPLLELCLRRAKGEPLQYILGSQPFGELDIKCEPGVLIPRPETEAYTAYLASKICSGLLDEHFKALIKREAFVRRQDPAAQRLKILDACSGSGCISLLLHSLLYQSDRLRPFGTLQIDGMDISEKALKLSKENLIRNVAKKHLSPEASSQVSFMKYNILKDRHGRGIFAPHDHNIIISNPPYISRQEYDTQIPRSVRDWEPELALVPSFSSGSAQHCDVDPADIFYKVLMEMYQNNGRKRSFMLVMEVGDEAQAKRVLELALKKYAMDKSNAVSVWRDSPDVRPSGDDLVVEGRTIPSEGQGTVRAVVFVRTFEAVDTKVKRTEDWRFIKKESWKHHRGSKKRPAPQDGNDTINTGRSNVLRSEYTRVKGTRQLKSIPKKPDLESRMASSFKATISYSSSSQNTPEIKP